MPQTSTYLTHDGGWSQLSFEWSLPQEDGAAWCGEPCGGLTTFVPEGSTVHAVIAYVVPPTHADLYYGPSDWLAALALETWGTPDMMHRIARDGALDVDVETGALFSVYPTVVEAAAGAIAAELTLSGGLGYRPVSFAGLVRHEGWQLQRLEADVWVDVDTDSPVGNDSWQADHEPTTDTWTLTYSVPVGAEAQTLRLYWIGG